MRERLGVAILVGIEIVKRMAKPAFVFVCLAVLLAMAFLILNLLAAETV